MKIKKQSFIFFNFFEKKLNYSQNRIIHWPIKKTNNLLANNVFLFNAFTRKNQWLRKTFKNKKYVKNLKKIRKNVSQFKLKKNNLTPFLIKNFYFIQKKKIFFFVQSYLFLLTNNELDIINFLIKKNKKKFKFFYYLFFTFKDNQRFFINFKNFDRINFLFLTQGFFLKFFEKKKSLKKTKTLKLLLARYLRKFLVLLNIKNKILIVKKNPTSLLEIISLINSPIIHKFNSPFSDKIIDDSQNVKTVFNASYCIFMKTLDFSKNKQKKRGRVKRKITRKIVLENAITD